MPKRSRYRERLKASAMEQDMQDVAKIGKITCKVCKKTFANVEEYKANKCDCTNINCPKREDKPKQDKKLENRFPINPKKETPKGSYYYHEVDDVITIQVKR